MKNANVKSTCRRFSDTEKKYGQKKLLLLYYIILLSTRIKWVLLLVYIGLF